MKKIIIALPKSVPMPLAAVLTSFLLLLVSCAPSLYSVNIKYEATQDVTKPFGHSAKYPITVALFKDARPDSDDLLIGSVLKSDGRRIPIIPRKNKLKKAISLSITDYLRQAGYTVSGDMPEWDLTNAGLKKEWGRLLIGGKVEDAQIICRDGIPVKKYTANVKFTVLFADPETGKIFYTVTAKGASSLEHVRLTEELLQQQIDAALSYAIEDAFSGADVKAQIAKYLEP